METTENRQRGRPRSFNGPTEAGAVQSLDRALRILAIVAEGSGLSLSEISAQSGLAKILGAGSRHSQLLQPRARLRL